MSGSDKTMKKDHGIFDHIKIFDVVTVGERGQVVIPAKARKEIGIKTGEKMVVIRPPVGPGLAMFKIDEVARMMGKMIDQFGKISAGQKKRKF